MTVKEAKEYLSKMPEELPVTITLEALDEKYVSETLDEKYVSAGIVIKKYNVSRQLLSYWIKEGYVRTIPYGKQKRYCLADIKKLRIEKDL